MYVFMQYFPKRLRGRCVRSDGSPNQTPGYFTTLVVMTVAIGDRGISTLALCVSTAPLRNELLFRACL